MVVVLRLVVVSPVLLLLLLLLLLSLVTVLNTQYPVPHYAIQSSLIPRFSVFPLFNISPPISESEKAKKRKRRFPAIEPPIFSF
jgi:hypothetical protein